MMLNHKLDVCIIYLGGGGGGGGGGEELNIKVQYCPFCATSQPFLKRLCINFPIFLK
jgi:hypothetical protein